LVIDANEFKRLRIEWITKMYRKINHAVYLNGSISLDGFIHHGNSELSGDLLPIWDSSAAFSGLTDDWNPGPNGYMRPGADGRLVSNGLTDHRNFGLVGETRHSRGGKNVMNQRASVSHAFGPLRARRIFEDCPIECGVCQGMALQMRWKALKHEHG